MVRRRRWAGWLLAALVGWCGEAGAEDWSRFRGPNGSGVAEPGPALPVRFGPGENLVWKVDLPGPGSSSPIVAGDRLFVTCWTGSATDGAASGDASRLRRHLLCLDRGTGATRWTRDVDAVANEEPYRGMFAENGYASHTPATDGERVYAFFGRSGVAAYDLDGKELWRARVGDGVDPRGWGSASSPILYKQLLIVTASSESRSLVAFDKRTGREVWRQEAEGLGSTWGTPILVEVDAKRTDLVLGVPQEIWGMNPETGKLRWFCEAMATDSYCSSVISDGTTVYGIEGRGGGSIAVRAGGNGDVTSTHVVWSGRDANRIGTPLVLDGRIYFFSGRVANCIDAPTGRKIYQQRLGDGDASSEAPPNRGGGGRGVRGQDYASPVAADGKLYFVTRAGDIHVLKQGDRFESLAVNRLTADAEDFSATPAVAAGRLYVRSSKRLYCVGLAETKEARR